MVLSGYAPSLDWLYVIFGIVGGFSSNLVYLPPFPVIGYYFERRRGLAMALASTGSGVGGVIMAPLIEVLFRSYGYSGGMLIIGGLTLNSCVASALLRPVTPTTATTTTQAPPPPDSTTRSKQTQGHLHGGQGHHHKVGGQSAWYYGSVASFGSFMALDLIPNGHCASPDDAPEPPAKYPTYRTLEGTEVGVGPDPDDPCLQIAARLLERRPNGVAHAQDTTEELATGSKARCHPPPGGARDAAARLKAALGRAARVASARMDLELLARPDFLLYCLMMLGYYTCFTTTNTFISGIALHIGFTDAQVALMLTASYALDTPSRLISGALFDVHALRRVHVPIMTGLGLVASLTAILLPMPTSMPGLFVLWAAYQFVFNGNQAQQVPLTVEIVGVDKAMSACGLARVFMGVGEVIGPAMGGAIKDKTGSYNLAFYIAGSALIGGCLIFQTYDTICRVRSPKRTEDVDTDPVQQTDVTA